MLHMSWTMSHFMLLRTCFGTLGSSALCLSPARPTSVNPMCSTTPPPVPHDRVTPRHPSTTPFPVPHDMGGSRGILSWGTGFNVLTVVDACRGIHPWMHVVECYRGKHVVDACRDVKNNLSVVGIRRGQQSCRGRVSWDA